MKRHLILSAIGMGAAFAVFELVGLNRLLARRLSPHFLEFELCIVLGVGIAHGILSAKARRPWQKFALLAAAGYLASIAGVAFVGWLRGASFFVPGAGVMNNLLAFVGFPIVTFGWAWGVMSGIPGFLSDRRRRQLKRQPG